jgi:pantetheine-phosphate adenylyltransferase
MKNCVYAGSFDPVTYGHLDIINRVSKTFDKVFVAVGVNSNKNYTFDLEHRIRHLKSNIANENVEVVSFDGLLADFAYENNIATIIKGVRNNQDFDYERLLHEITTTQQSGIDTHILITDQKLSHVSSTAVKELCKLQGLTQDYVPLNVKEDLEYALNKQFIFGVTGSIGMGKSYVSEKLRTHMSFKLGYKCAHNIDLDKIAHKLYESNLPVHLNLKETIVKEYNLKNGFNRKELGEIVFNDKDKLDHLNNLIRIPLLTELRKEIKGKTGLILLNSALLVESQYLSLCNNNIILVESTKEQQIENLKKRGLTSDQILRRVSSQMDNSTKLKNIQESIQKHKHGVCIEYSNQFYGDSIDDYFIKTLLIVSNKCVWFMDPNDDKTYILGSSGCW